MAGFGTTFALPIPVFLRTLSITAFVALLVGAVYAMADDYSYLRAMEVPHPFCERITDLTVAGDYFVEIANDLPGRVEYNDLVKTYKEKNWDLFDDKWRSFHKEFEISPLQEAAAFLFVQSKFDRIAPGPEQEANVRDAEKSLTEAELMYRKSTLIPVVSAGAAAYWLANHQTQRSLAEYESSRAKYADHPLACVFDFGAGESNFLLRDFDQATTVFKQIVEKCKNPRLRVGAEMRLADIEWLKGSSKAEALYEVALNDNNPMVDRYFPVLFHNLGELKYRAKNYSSAKFFFEEFNRLEKKDSPCITAGLKRLADIGFRTGKKWQDASGAYLSVYQASPKSDLGHLSYVDGLLLGTASFGKVEYTRRIKIIDEQIDQITDPALKSLAYLQKGLVMLDAGEKNALEYLIRLNSRTHFDLEQGTIAQFVREKLVKSLDEGKKSGDQKGRHPKPVEKMAEIETAFQLWLKGTQYEDWAKKHYAQIVIAAFEDAAKQNDFNEAFEILGHWKKSSLWPSDGPDKSERQKIGTTLYRGLVVTPETSEKVVFDRALNFLKTEPQIRAFIDREMPALWTKVALITGDDSRLKKSLEGWKRDRGPASVENEIPADLRSEVWLTAALAYLQTEAYTESERALTHVTDPKFRERKLSTELNIFLKTKNFPKAYDTAMLGYAKLPDAQRKAQLNALYGIATEGKLWKQASSLRDLAVKAGLTGKELAPFQFFAGRSAFEKGNWKQAIESFEAGLKLAPEATDGPEAMFRLGKSLAKTKKEAQARKVWEDLAKVNDPFWSPLAQNEIKTQDMSFKTSHKQ